MKSGSKKTVRCSVGACLMNKSPLLRGFQITGLCFYKSINTEALCFVSADKQAFSAAGTRDVSAAAWWFHRLERQACNYLAADCDYRSSPSLHTSY